MFIILLIVILVFNIFNNIVADNGIEIAKSGIGEWIDLNTPSNLHKIKNSRGEIWNLVMSDEFNEPNRDFRVGKDHLWTAVEIPDGVNSALNYYSTNQTSTIKDSSGRGYFQIKISKDVINFTVYNLYSNPPGYQNETMYYRSGMVQSWNKFCFQGGLMEVNVQLPAAVSSKSGNPDLKESKTKRVSDVGYYPTWPGIWLMGNLGRAVFSSSTNRQWPWSFNECNKELESFQRISACNSNPGYGLNPNQGRGAPEIDILEGGGTDISSSIQVAPGMPDKFRLFEPDDTMCIYSSSCKNVGANNIGIPTAKYATRPYKSWYQGLKYATNALCTAENDAKQSLATIKNSIATGITENKCSLSICPASYDLYGEISQISNTSKEYWGVNINGYCMAKKNIYMGSFLCDLNNQNKKCLKPRNDTTPLRPNISPFAYQMDALSANWPIHLAAYTDFVKYQMEWVTGSNGYIRWMIENVVIFEIPASSLTDPPQDTNKSNYKKIMIEEPMYIIFNVALSTSWGATPPNAKKQCEGDGKNVKTNRICADFPMYLKIDYIRIWQDTNKMQIGCNPKSHPTKEFINQNIKDYIDPLNPYIVVSGGANCKTDDDCTLSMDTTTRIKTGNCIKNKCSCNMPRNWGGPRCISAMGGSYSTNSENTTSSGKDPSIEVTSSLTLFVLVCTMIILIKQKKKEKREAKKNANLSRSK